MRYRTEDYTVPHTIDGRTEYLTRTRTVPAPPTDWDQVGLRGGFIIVLTLTVLSITWSTWSIGSLLGGGPIAYAAAFVFDASWATVLIFEWLSRYRSDDLKVIRAMGWLLLLATMGAIAAHGFQLDNLAMAVVGAGVSGVAKTLWMIAMRHVHVELPRDDADWVKAQENRVRAQVVLDRRIAKLGVRDTRPAVSGQSQDSPGQLSRPVPDSPAVVPDNARTAQVSPVPSVSETVLDAIRTHGQDRDTVLDVVRSVHPQVKEDTFRKTYARAVAKVEREPNGGYA